ncbi:unnamed protein product [Protopolystoma xenopodis]|uniref:Uncharacterized protein n=1 Tax=Protopolystoma xenopodis TaxID=117903 RepID=A0A448X3B0_9PLAT|nr:unnamed protein product [Protopolystoma xenopodis]
MPSSPVPNRADRPTGRPSCYSQLTMSTQTRVDTQAWPPLRGQSEQIRGPRSPGEAGMATRTATPARQTMGHPETKASQELVEPSGECPSLVAPKGPQIVCTKPLLLARQVVCFLHSLHPFSLSLSFSLSLTHTHTYTHRYSVKPQLTSSETLRTIICLGQSLLSGPGSRRRPVSSASPSSSGSRTVDKQ